MRRLSSLAPGLLVVLAAGVTSAPARADWPVARHDLARTATAPGASSIVTPTRYWQVYMGGSLGATTHVAVDVDKDGTTDVVYVAGGKVLAKLPDDRLVWESPPVEIGSLVGVVDLDGDGALEVVAQASRNVFVLSGTTGQILWKQPDGEVGQVGGVRLADLDGDGRPEIVIDECGCCGIDATASPPGGIYKFTTGKMTTPTKLGTPAARSHCGSSAVTVGDLDGDGGDDVAYGSDAGYLVVSGKTGATLGTSSTVGENLYYSACEAANVDDRPGAELVCFQDSYLASSSRGGRRIVVLTYDAAATPPLKTLWNVEGAPKATGRLSFLGSSLGDLDADGKIEVVASWHDGSAWSTVVYDAKTGATLGTIAGEQLQGVVDLDGDKKPEILTRGGGAIVARRFERGALPAISTFASLPAALSVPSQNDWSRLGRAGARSIPIALDLKGDGKTAAVFYDGTARKYAAYRFAPDGTGTAAASFTVPDGVAILTNQAFGPVNRTYPQLLLTRNDGYLLVLDDAFAPTNAVTIGSGEFKTTLPGMRVGGFLAQPIAPRLDGGRDAIVVTDSRGYLERLDAGEAWMAKPPSVKWQLAGAHDPSFAPAIDAGKPGLVCSRGAKAAALSSAGAVLWEATMPGGGAVHADPLSADLDGDGASDVVTASVGAGSVLTIQAWSGAGGAAMWSSPVSEALSWGFQPFSLADHDGDGKPDVWHVLNRLQVHKGSTGAKLAENPAFLAYFTPAIADVDGDGVLDVTLSRGYYPARTLKKDLVTAAWTGGDDRPYQHGARAVCGARSVWVQPSSQQKALVRLVTMNGAEVGTTKSLWLAGGKVFATPEAAGATFLGTLGDVAIKQDLVGKGDHPSALVGSTDGFLYAIDPCAGALDWALDMEFAVGNPILADTNGDGVDQVLVPAADGYLHAIGPRLLDAPAEVNDNDPYAAVPAPDVDEARTKEWLGASWSAVTGADAYQVAVLTEGGTYVTQPDWIDVGGTSTILKGLSLATGKKYVVAVRAVSKTKGSSVERRSDGVTILEPVAPDGGLGDATLGDDTGVETDAAGDAAPPTPTAAPSEASGCGCRTTSRSGSGALVLAFAGVALAFARRRRLR